MSEKDEHQEWIEFNDWISMYGSAERALRVALKRLSKPIEEKTVYHTYVGSGVSITVTVDPEHPNLKPTFDAEKIKLEIETLREFSCLFGRFYNRPCHYNYGYYEEEVRKTIKRLLAALGIEDES